MNTNTPALPLRRSASTLLVCLLASLLTGCNSNESDTQPTVSLKATPEQTKAPVDISKNAHETPVPLPEPVTQTSPPPVSVSAVKLIIEVNRATDSIDLDALQSGSGLPALPLQLSVDLSQAPLRAVLRELARKLGAKISITDSVPDQLISLQFSGVDVAEGIKQLLRETNYLLIYKEPPAHSNPNQGIGTEIPEIRILPKSGTEEISNESASLKILEPIDQTAEIAEWKKQALTAEKPEDRLMALKQFLEHADPAEHNTVLIAALEDKAAEVRMFALNSMGDSANPLLEPISQAALSDESPQIRTAALDVLISRYGQDAIPVLEQALADPDATVQQTARSSLEMAQRVKSQIEAMRHRQPK